MPKKYSRLRHHLHRLHHQRYRVFDLFGHYDRGMVYRFNDDDSGEVIHEIKKDDIERMGIVSQKVKLYEELDTE